MKYNRTKDGRILKVFMENISSFGKNDALAYYGENTIDFETSYFLPKTEIIKQADTIEELCDEFVFIGYKIKYPFLFSKEGISIDDFWKHSPSDTVVYGAIWTEWGLKYVAKMNEKGELELI